MAPEYSIQGTTMKYLIPAIFMLSLQSAFSQDVRVKIEDFSFQYDDPKGAGEATLFQHNQKGLEGVRVEVEKIGEAMNFKVSGMQEFP